MSGLGNISHQSLAVSGNCLPLLLANVLIVEDRTRHISTADKGGSPETILFRQFRTFAKTSQGRLASLYLYIQQVFRSQMANVTKNSKATAQGVVASTPSGAKTVSKSKIRTKADILKLLYDEHQKARDAEASRKELLRVIAAKDDVIREKDSEIAKLERRVNLIGTLRDSLSICVQSLCVSLNAMNKHCEILRSSKS